MGKYVLSVYNLFASFIRVMYLSTFKYYFMNPAALFDVFVLLLSYP